MSPLICSPPPVTCSENIYPHLDVHRMWWPPWAAVSSLSQDWQCSLTLPKPLLVYSFSLLTVTL